MRVDFRGRLVDEPEIRAGFIGCGSHSWRNVYPTFHFAPVKLAATCDLQIEKAREFAARLGAGITAYSAHREMLEKEKLDAVFIVVGYDERGRPLYPPLAVDCMKAGCHVWIEKPPAASCADIESMQAASKVSGKNVVVGLKKMFMPANEKAAELIALPEFGKPCLAMLQYPQQIPPVEEFAAYLEKGERIRPVVGFLDHICHPMSLMVGLMGAPETVSYERASSGAGAATFRFASGAVATLALTRGSSHNGGMEHTTIVSNSGVHVTVDNNLRVTYHRTPPPAAGTGYGHAPNFYTGGINDAAAYWEPEFSLGQLYNKGLFLLGYYNEVNEFARSILEGRPPRKGTLEQAWQITRVFEAFARGPGKTVRLSDLKIV